MRKAALRALALSALLGAATARAGDAPRCTPEVEASLGAGWSALRADSLFDALAVFERAEQLCPALVDAKLGLGYTHLKLGYLMRAESLFIAVTTLDPSNPSGWDGLMDSAYRLGDYSVAVRAARHSWQLHQNPDARLILDHLYPGWDLPSRPRARRPDTLVVPVRARNERFEIQAPGGWRPLYVKGIHLGPVLPGRKSGVFPRDSALYAGWLASISDMNANAVRVATLLPPEFYRALAAWNLAQPERTLWLIQGIEAGVPPGGDYAQPRWVATFRTDARSVVDALHGDAEVVEERGHSGGHFDADVSAWTLACVIAVPGDSETVAAFNARVPSRRAFRGQYFTMSDGTAMDAWLAERSDDLADYEVERYNALRPLAYAGGTRFERSASGARPLLDPNDIRATNANPAGWFVSWRAFPFDPALQSGGAAVSRARSSEGLSSWFGYLRGLSRRSGLPVLVDGYGVPSSRGVTRLQPQGWNEGGHDEAQMAAIDARLTREIRESGCAGGVLFEWMDQWHRQGSGVEDLGVPTTRAPLWHDAMNPDQHYGVMALDAGAGSPGQTGFTPPELGGPASVWRKLQVVQQVQRPAKRREWAAAGWPRPRGTPLSISAGADASYLYLAIELAGADGRPFRWDSIGVCVGLDTYRTDLGQRMLPGELAGSQAGFEFLIDFKGPAQAELLVTPDYNPFAGPRDAQGRRLFELPVVTVLREDGRFDSLLAPLRGAPSQRAPVSWTDRGRLRHGSLQRSSLADWYYDAYAGLIEIRLPWSLLNVADPSTRSVLFREAGAPEFAVRPGDGLRFGVLSYRKGPPGRVLAALPALDPVGVWRASDLVTWTWKGWEEPVYHTRLKPAYDAIRAVWGSMLEELSTRGNPRPGTVPASVGGKR